MFAHSFNFNTLFKKLIDLNKSKLILQYQLYNINSSYSSKITQVQRTEMERLATSYSIFLLSCFLWVLIKINKYFLR